MIIWYHPANNLGTQLLPSPRQRRIVPWQTQRAFFFRYTVVEFRVKQLAFTMVGTSQSCYWKNPPIPPKISGPHKVFISRMLFVVVVVPMATRLQWEIKASSSKKLPTGSLAVAHTRDGDSSSNMKMANTSPHSSRERTCSMFQSALVIIYWKLLRIHVQGLPIGDCWVAGFLQRKQELQICNLLLHECKD